MGGGLNVFKFRLTKKNTYVSEQCMYLKTLLTQCIISLRLFNYFMFSIQVI